jgi:uncharacterized protein (DUF302 family)
MVERVTYGLYRETGKDFGEAREALLAALKKRGFGVLWEIDVQRTLKEKIGAEMAPYVILGACNPPIAHQALTAEPNIGLLLPCNCIVRRQGDRTVLGALEPHALMGLTGRDDLGPFADQVQKLLSEAVDEAAG